MDVPRYPAVHAEGVPVIGRRGLCVYEPISAGARREGQTSVASRTIVPFTVTESARKEDGVPSVIMAGWSSAWHPEHLHQWGDGQSLHEQGKENHPVGHGQEWQAIGEIHRQA